MPSFILIHPTVWPQYTNVTDRQDRQDRTTRLHLWTNVFDIDFNGKTKSSTLVCYAYFNVVISGVVH